MTAAAGGRRRAGAASRRARAALLLPVAAAGALALSACGSPPPGSDGAASSTTTSSSSGPTTTVRPTCEPKPEAEALPPHFEVWLTLDKTVVAVGEPIVFTVHARNNSSEPFEYVDPHGGPTHDVFVAAEDGTVVWQARYQAVAPAVISPKRFEPGEEQVRQERWRGEMCTSGGSPGFSSPGTAGPGRYTAHALWRNGWWAEPVAFEVR